MTLTGGGAYPFRTGISAYRLASFEIMSKTWYFIRAGTDLWR